MATTRFTLKGVEFKNRVFVASGTYGYGDDCQDVADVSKLGDIITKSLSLKPRPGNPPVRIVETASGMLNSIGLANIGVHRFIAEKLPFLKTDAAGQPNVGACWNSNQTDLDGEGWDHNFNLLKSRINAVHITDLFNESYPYRKLFTGLNEIGYTGFCLAEIAGSTDPIRVMKYYRALWLAYQNLL